MSTSVDSSSSVDRSADTSRVDSTNDVAQADASAKADLTASTAAVSEADADNVANDVVGDVDAVEKAGGTPTASALPSTEPNAANRAAADGFNSEFAKIEADQMNFDKNRSYNDVLGRVADHAQGIKDPAERDRFVRAVAPAAGRAAGERARSTPSDAFRQLDAIGHGVSPETGKLLARSAMETPRGRDNLAPMAHGNSPVANGFRELNRESAEKMGKVVEGAARFAIPGVDAGVRALNGDYSGAAASLGTDLAGGALLRGGKLAAGVVAGGVALSPDDAQAGVVGRFTMKFGDEAVEVTNRSTVAKGRHRAVDVEVPGRFADGTEGSLRLADARGKHTKLADVDDSNPNKLARQANSKSKSPYDIAGKEGQFIGRFSSPAGQAELAREIMGRVTPADLARVGQAGGELTLKLDRVVGLTSNGRGQVVPATAVRIMANGDGAFHLVPMP